uniref:Ovule protein n=1 Tax=Heterorhabditis bacteriophora TaxID=37862 RepID=A0A1I7WBH6_HETBA
MSCRQDRWCSSKFSKIVTIINKSLEAFYLYCYNCYLLINLLGRYNVQSNEEWRRAWNISCENTSRHIDSQFKPSTC